MTTCGRSFSISITPKTLVSNLVNVDRLAAPVSRQPVHRDFLSNVVVLTD